jgi:hypothetical protein
MTVRVGVAEIEVSFHRASQSRRGIYQGCDLAHVARLRSSGVSAYNPVI